MGAQLKRKVWVASLCDLISASTYVAWTGDIRWSIAVFLSGHTALKLTPHLTRLSHVDSLEDVNLFETLLPRNISVVV